MPKYIAKVSGGKLWYENQPLFDWDMRNLDGKKVVVEIHAEAQSRTALQNRALHKLFALMAEAFNDAGMDVNMVLSQKIAHPWTPSLVKELIWRKVQDSYLGKKSTTQLTTDEINKVYDVINRHLGETFGFTMPPFPSVEQLMAEGLVAPEQAENAPKPPQDNFFSKKR